MLGGSPIYWIHTDLINKIKKEVFFYGFSAHYAIQICNPYIKFIMRENRVRNRESEVVSTSGEKRKKPSKRVKKKKRATHLSCVSLCREATLEKREDVNVDLKNVVDMHETQVDKPIEVIPPEPLVDPLSRRSAREDILHKNIPLMSLCCWLMGESLKVMKKLCGVRPVKIN